MIRDYDSWIDTDRIVWFDEAGNETANAPAEPLSRYRLAMAFNRADRKQDALGALNTGAAPDKGTFLLDGEKQDLAGAWKKLLSELQ